MPVSTLRWVADEFWHGNSLSMVSVSLWTPVNGSKPGALIPQGFWRAGIPHRLCQMSLVSYDGLAALLLSLNLFNEYAN
jgi:hypothetical protein